MEIETLASAIAIAVSIASALYARNAVKEAQRANNVAIHSSRLDVYQTFSKFRASLLMHGGDFPKEDLYGCYSASKVAEFYFSAETAKLFGDLIDSGDEFLRARWKWNRADEKPIAPDNYDELVNDAYDKLEPLRDLTESVELEMRKELIVVGI